MNHRINGVIRQYTGRRHSCHRKDNRWIMCGKSPGGILPVRKRTTIRQLRWWGDSSDYSFLLQGYLCGGWQKAGHKYRILRSIRHHPVRPVRIRRLHGVFHMQDSGVQTVLNQPMLEPREMSRVLWEQASTQNYLIPWEKGHLCRVSRTRTIFQSKEETLPAIYGYKIQHLTGPEQRFWAWHRKQIDGLDLFWKSVEAARGWFLMAESKDEISPTDLFPWEFMEAEKSSDEMVTGYLPCLLFRLDLWGSRLLLFPEQRESIHQYRVTLRKMRMIFSYADVEKNMAIQLRRIFRKTSSVRDCDICLQALEEYRDEMMRNSQFFSLENEATLTRLQSSVEQIRQDYLERLVRRLQAHPYAQMINRLWGLTEQWRIKQEWPDTGDKDLNIVAVRECDQVSRELDRLPELERNEIHQVRIRIKKLRYLLEAMDPKRYNQLVNEWIFWQDILGVWLDSVVCQQLLAQQAMRSAGSVHDDIELWLKEKQGRIWQEIVEALQCRTLPSDRRSENDDE